MTNTASRGVKPFVSVVIHNVFCYFLVVPGGLLLVSSRAFPQPFRLHVGDGQIRQVSDGMVGLDQVELMPRGVP